MDSVLGVEMARIAGDRVRRVGALNAEERIAAERRADAIFVAISIALEGW